MDREAFVIETGMSTGGTSPFEGVQMQQGAAPQQSGRAMVGVENLARNGPPNVSAFLHKVSVRGCNRKIRGFPAIDQQVSYLFFASLSLLPRPPLLAVT